MACLKASHPEDSSLLMTWPARRTWPVKQTSTYFSRISTDLTSGRKNWRYIHSPLEVFHPADDMEQEESWLLLSTWPLSARLLHNQIPQSKDSKDLGWDLHIADITSRASHTLGFVRWNLCVCSHKVKAAAYKALVRPLLEYANPVWDSHTISCSDSIEKGMQQDGPCRTTGQHPGWLPCLKNWTGHCCSQEVRKAGSACCTSSGLVCWISILSIVPTIGNQKSCHQTNSCTFDVLYHSILYQQQTFFPLTIRIWNSLPEAVTTAPALASFESRVQNHL